MNAPAHRIAEKAAVFAHQMTDEVAQAIGLLFREEANKEDEER